MKLSGFSHPTGCNIYGERHKLRVYERFGRTKFEIKKKRDWKVNPIILFFPLIDVVILSMPYVFAFITELLPQGAVDTLSSIPDWVIYIFAIGGSAYFFYIIIRDLLLTRRWHGCEHKLIAAAENNDVFGAKDYSPIHEKCGTTYLFTMFVALALSQVVFGYAYFTVAVIAILIEGKFFHKHNKVGIAIGKKIQQFNALEPEGYKLHVGMKGMKELIKVESE